MARVTVEDCIQYIPNRFELVIMAAQRAKQISGGAPLTVDRDNDKDAVVALREIAERTIDIERLKEEIIVSNCKRQSPEEFEAIPFAGEIEDHLSKQVAQEMAEAGKIIPQAPQEAAEEGGEGLSFAGDNLDVDD